MVLVKWQVSLGKSLSAQATLVGSKLDCQDVVMGALQRYRRGPYRPVVPPSDVVPPAVAAARSRLSEEDVPDDWILVGDPPLSRR